MKFGKTKLPFNKGKNIEGTIVGLTLAFLGALIFVDPISALIAATVGMLMEGIPCPLNDNFTIPLATGLVLLLLM
jgi:dolichol kinase